MKVQVSNVFARVVAVSKGKHCGKAFIFKKGENGSRFLGFIKLQKKHNHVGFNRELTSILINIFLYGVRNIVEKSVLKNK